MKQTLSKKLGQQLKKYREEYSYSQEELADILKLSPKTISKYEINGIPGIDTVDEINKALEINLFDGYDAINNAGNEKSIKTNIIKFQNGSFVVEDLNGQMLNKKGKQLEKDGYLIKVLNLKDPKHSNNYNPLSYIKTEMDTLHLANRLMKATEDYSVKTIDGFWEIQKVY